MLRIAHISDPHIVSAAGVKWREMLFNKRVTGYANTVLRRKRVHRRDYLEAVLDAVSSSADHLVVTGDVTNLALESEYHEALGLLQDVARSIEVTLVPGNHDIYLPPISRDGRFAHHFGAFVKSDLPELAVPVAAGSYPLVKLRGPAAIVGVSSAVPRPPFIAAGRIGGDQLAALERVLAHPEVTKRVPVILIHHPPVDPRSRLKRLRDGLTDAASFRQALAPLSRGLVLFGHLHFRMRCALGSLDAVSASGAALDHPDESIRAGFNLYTIDEKGRLAGIEAHVLDPAGVAFRRTAIRRTS
jgi:3',5'-cyclic AMP phosphodiesterase CpdA